ncbi:MAG: amidohydrolase family protein [Ignavibacteria bacterium]|jgi:N-acetylglucosamine-6-phosphate deacetylase
MKKIQIINGKALLPNGLDKVNIEIEDGVITKISKQLKRDSLAQIIDAKGRFIIPGFIDLHTNGIGGFDLTNGWYNHEKKSFSISKDKYLHGIENALMEFAKHGTTLVGFTTLEAAVKRMKKIFTLIAEYKNNSESVLKNIFHGIYMEGTFMKDAEYKGAHNPKYFFKPSIKLFDEFQKAADGNIKIVNVVPEWGKDALKLIEYLTNKKILCAAGHTSANGNEYFAAVEKGLQLAIHVLNGPSSSSFKPFDNGGALESLLKSDKIHAEIIPDGYHVDKSYLLDIIKRKGINRCIAISDSMFVTNMKKIKEFKINGVVGKVSKNKEYIHIAGKENINSLFGSVLTMDKAFENLISWFTQPVEGIWNKLHKPLGFEEALLNASKMCSQNPAKILGLNSKGNKQNTGSIEIGNSADLVVTEIHKSDSYYQLNIDKVLLKGNMVFTK